MQKRSTCCRRSLPPLEKVSVSPSHWNLIKVASWSLRASVRFPFLGESQLTCCFFFELLYIFGHVEHFKTFVIFPVLFFCRCRFSIWILLTKACRDKLCGVFHHVDSQNNFATPTVFLTGSGRIASPGLVLLEPELHCFVFNTPRSVARPGEGGR